MQWLAGSGRCQESCTGKLLTIRILQLSVNLQSGLDKKDCKVNFDDHIRVELFKDSSNVADDHENGGWNEDSEDIADEGTTDADIDHNCLLLANYGATHLNFTHKMAVETNVSIVSQFRRFQVKEVASLKKFHTANLCVKRVHCSVIVTDELHTKLLYQGQHIL